ncbi:DUF1514 family protein [Staphylococcus pasteuri]|uniref:DUF1514 family protein n=1 Tax=Staphylococcus pasteuri TaxID=45972 RepID=UPI002277B7FF|nr:DUF1514 family protein [Staphylococcus pasteuri]MCD9065996.1 DUF1514 family protein [Staphylococcus pasteuri]WAE41299.1 DUF1514 family protein [Staphylococcus pasteuri]
MWIIISMILAIIILILIGNNSVLRNENNTLRYTNVYLFTRFVKDNGEDGLIEFDKVMEEMTKKFK